MWPDFKASSAIGLCGFGYYIHQCPLDKWSNKLYFYYKALTCRVMEQPQDLHLASWRHRKANSVSLFWTIKLTSWEPQEATQYCTVADNIQKARQTPWPWGVSCPTSPDSGQGISALQESTLPSAVRKNRGTQPVMGQRNYCPCFDPKVKAIRTCPEISIASGISSYSRAVWNDTGVPWPKQLETSARLANISAGG